MSHTYENVKIVSYIAGEDLRNDFGALLRFENDDGALKVIKTTGANAAAARALAPAGFLAEEPNGTESTDGKVVPVVIPDAGGIVTARAGAAITAGQVVVADVTAGRVAGVANLAGMSADTYAVGYAMENAADGDYLRVSLRALTSATD